MPSVNGLTDPVMSAEHLNFGGGKNNQEEAERKKPRPPLLQER